MTPERQKENWRRYYAKNKDKINAARKVQREANPPKRDYIKEAAKVSDKKSTPEGWLGYAITHARHRAKKNGLPFNISKQDVVLPTHCPVLDIQLMYGTVRKPNETRTVENIPSLDRHRNELGYVKGNVRVISARANSLKSNATIEEIQKILDYMRDENEPVPDTC